MINVQFKPVKIVAALAKNSGYIYKGLDSWAKMNKVNKLGPGMDVRFVDSRGEKISDGRVEKIKGACIKLSGLTKDIPKGNYIIKNPDFVDAL